MRATRNVLITGGAGYVGGHTALALRARGWRVVVIDDLSGSTGDVAAHADRFVCADVRQPGAVAAVVAEEEIDGIVHCAARIVVSESMADPLAYYRVNVEGALRVAEAAVGRGVPVVLSSSAGVYGSPASVPVAEDAVLAPMSPYGRTKRILEEALFDCATAYGLPVIALRYFNAAGADPEGRHGEAHEPETHLIPNVLRAGLAGLAVTIYGDDHPTPDGTCVRDYVHVSDLARAHGQALQALWDGVEPQAVNLGSGVGWSVREVVDACGRALGAPVETRIAARRPGDPPVLTADVTRAREVLGWSPRHHLDDIVRTALSWHRREAR